VTYLPDEPPEPAPSPTLVAEGDPRPTMRRGIVLRSAPFMIGAAAMLGLVLAWGASQPAVDPLTSTDVRQAIDDALASQTPPPAVAEAIYGAIQPSIVLIDADREADDGTESRGEGTGVVINDGGDVLTALHVVQDAETITLRFADGSEISGSITAADEETDIAVVTPDQLPGLVVPAVLGNPASLRIGSDAYIVGNPFGLYGSMSTGVVSGLERSFRDPDTEVVRSGLIQVDAAVNPGNSGGPLLDRAGRVVGIVVALLNPTREDVFIGIGLAVPIDVAGGAAGLPDH
jgi:S1-C subfamily serine protease